MKHLLTILILLSSVLTTYAESDSQTIVKMQTTSGDIIIALYNQTPRHRDNFKKLVSEGVYDSLLFHRVICDFMIQGGDPTSKNAEKGKMLGEGDLGYTIEPEFKIPELYHKRGAVAMAREGDATNPERKSSSSQFYIVTGKTFTENQLDYIQTRLDNITDNSVKLTEEMKNTYMKNGGVPQLDGQYTVFGEVIKGMDVVEKIQHSATDAYDRPIEDVIILKAEIIK